MSREVNVRVGSDWMGSVRMGNVRMGNVRLGNFLMENFLMENVRMKNVWIENFRMGNVRLPDHNVLYAFSYINSICSSVLIIFIPIRYTGLCKKTMKLNYQHHKK